MSNKTECPGCGSYTSSVTSAVMDGGPCPYCGLSASAILEIMTLRDSRADAAVKQRLEECLVLVDKLVAENTTLRQVVGNVRSVIGSAPPRSLDDHLDSLTPEFVQGLQDFADGRGPLPVVPDDGGG